MDIFFFAVPPSIIDARTSADIVVKEGSPVNLSCDARGSPRPKIMWKREDGDLIRYNGGNIPQYTMSFKTRKKVHFGRTMNALYASMAEFNWSTYGSISTLRRTHL